MCYGLLLLLGVCLHPWISISVESKLMFHIFAKFVGIIAYKIKQQQQHLPNTQTKYSNLKSKGKKWTVCERRRKIYVKRAYFKGSKADYQPIILK